MPYGWFWISFDLITYIELLPYIPSPMISSVYGRVTIIILILYIYLDVIDVCSIINYYYTCYTGTIVKHTLNNNTMLNRLGINTTTGWFRVNVEVGNVNDKNINYCLKWHLFYGEHSWHTSEPPAPLVHREYNNYIYRFIRTKKKKMLILQYIGSYSNIIHLSLL